MCSIPSTSWTSAASTSPKRNNTVFDTVPRGFLSPGTRRIWKIREEEREIEGASFPAEVYPQTDYDPETVFYFADDGSLAYCYTAAPVVESAAYIGDILYTVESIDGEVDESLFDISSYEIH